LCKELLFDEKSLLENIPKVHIKVKIAKNQRIRQNRIFENNEPSEK